MARRNTTCGNLDVHIRPLLRYLREHKKIWEGGKGKNRVRTAWRSGGHLGQLPAHPLTLPDVCRAATRAAFRKKLQIWPRHSSPEGRMGKEGTEGKGGRRCGKKYSQLQTQCPPRSVHEFPFPIPTRWGSIGSASVKRDQVIIFVQSSLGSSNCVSTSRVQKRQRGARGITAGISGLKLLT